MRTETVPLRADPSRSWTARLWLLRAAIALTIGLGVNYIVWRWAVSIYWPMWWIAVPLAVAETQSLLDAVFFGIMMWRSRSRGPAPAAPPDLTVDVFIATYNEPLDIVMATAAGALAIRYPHQTWILDDGDRAELRARAHAAGVGYMTRSADWANRPRHAKAGNLNNALMNTDGEFLLVLDADQVPDPAILDRTLGWFNDPLVALVQTPQWFRNVEPADPLGSQAPLFYGPIQQGLDGWNAAYFCGSNAILRREALLRLGLTGYVREVRTAAREALATANRVLARAARRYAAEPGVAAALAEARAASADARRQLDRGEPLAEVTRRFHERVEAAAAALVSQEMAALDADLAELGLARGREAGPLMETDDELGLPVVDERGLNRLTLLELSPLAAIDSVRGLLRDIDVVRGGEAQPIMPMATISVTEDMATSMRLHSQGWRSVYHHEILALGLAPEDLSTMLQQRLRWAQGTLQLLLRENPLVLRGLSVGQRLMYFSVMWSYLSGFATIFYLAGPILYLGFGIRPVHSFGGGYMWRLVPYLIATQLIFLVAGYGVKTWRGQQYQMALFPLFIRAVTTAAANVWFGRSLGFVVTSKTRQSGGSSWRLVWPQLTAVALLVAYAIAGLVRAGLGLAPSIEGTLVNIGWVGYDLLMLSVIFRAVRYTGYQPADRPIQESTP